MGSAPNQQRLARLLSKLMDVLPAELVADLNPGATSGQIAQHERFLGHSLPAEAKMLYRWANGADSLGFIPEFGFLSLDESVIRMPEPDHDYPFPKDVFLIFGAERLLYLSLRGDSEGLYYWEPGIGTRGRLAFDSLLHFFETVFDAWTQGVFRMGRSGYRGRRFPIVDFTNYDQHKTWNECFRKHNPRAGRTRIAILNTPFSVDPPTAPKSDLFTPEEYYGFAQTFSTQLLEKHWSEMLTEQKLYTNGSLRDLRKEIEWLDMITRLVSGPGALDSVMKNTGSRERVRRVQRQIEFLNSLQRAVKALYRRCRAGRSS